MRQFVDSDDINWLVLENNHWYGMRREAVPGDELGEYDKFRAKLDPAELPHAQKLGMSLDDYRDMIKRAADQAADDLYRMHNRPGFMAKYLKRGKT